MIAFVEKFPCFVDNKRVTYSDFLHLSSYNYPMHLCMSVLNICGQFSIRNAPHKLSCMESVMSNIFSLNCKGI